ncbi:MAG: hypothetical protein R6V78_06595, partial [Desulfosarcina sp.]
RVVVHEDALAARAGALDLEFIISVVLLGWALFGPMKSSILSISEAVPGYWERLQKPLIKMEQQAVLSEEKLQAEVRTEISSRPGPGRHCSLW